jgi:hypothetical protein
LEKLDKVLLEKKQFEQKIALEPVAPSHQESEEELRELSRLASEVPSLWQNESVTYQERKEILRCLIDHIVVAVTEEKIDATIVWKAGGKTPVFLWRRPGRHHLIRELHTQQLTAVEIKEHLAAGKTSTGQVVNISLWRVLEKLHAMGLIAARHSTEYLLARRKAAELYREGRSAEWIAQYLTEQGFSSASGAPWTALMVYGVLRAIGETRQSLDDSHRKLIAEALARGLDYSEIACEFNHKNVRLRGRPPWTARKVARTCRKLGLLQCELAQKGTTDTEKVEPALLNRADHAPTSPTGNRCSATRRHLPRTRHRHLQPVRSAAVGAKNGRTSMRRSTRRNINNK